MEEREIYRAKILSEAVPYLQEYNGKTVVVKIWWKCDDQ